MKGPKELLAELEPLCRARAAQRQPLRVTPKMQAAQEALERHFHFGFAPNRQCYALLDVLRLGLDENPTAALKALDFLHSDAKHRVERKTSDEFLPYRYVHWFHGPGSVAMVCVDSDRQAPWLKPFRVTMYANDAKGLLAEDVLQILEVLPFTCVLMLELALDFPLASGVSRDFIRRHGVFGKARRDSSVPNSNVDWWGARRAQKRTKSYAKWEIAAQRLEWKLLRHFLDTHGIRDIFDFPRLAELLPERHVLFADLSEEQLVRRLRKSGYGAAKIQVILGNLRERQNDLCGVLDYLRRQVRLTNTRRLLVPVPQNQLVRDALQSWAKMWPTKPRGLLAAGSNRSKQRRRQTK